MKIDKNSQQIKEILSQGVEEVIQKENLIKKIKSGEILKIKHGIDPTSPYIHLGNAISLWKLRQFQKLGHQIILIIGDFTARIGDTSDKKSLRQPLSKKQIEYNMKNYKKQIGRILDLKKTKFVYNSSWLKKITLEEILNLTSRFTVAQMIERKNFTERYKTGKPIGLNEFLYPLMQGYDSVAVKADVEIGGTDQKFNMLAGRIIQKLYNQLPQNIITLTLIEGSDDRKMSKSFGNVINITDKPNNMFGKIMSMKDNLIVKYFILCTKMPLEKINEIETGLKLKKLNPRNAKVQLAKEIISLYYNKIIAKKAEKEFERIFQEKKLPSKIPKIQIKEKSVNILELLVKTKLASSRSEAKRLILQKGVKINGKIQKSWQEIVKIKKGQVLQVGKRKFLKIN